MRIRYLVMLVTTLGLAVTVPSAPGAAADTGQPHPLVGMHAEAMHAPWRVPGDDGRDHLAYQLEVTNLMAVPAALTAVSVRDEQGRQLQFRTGDDLAMRVQDLGSGVITAEIAPSASAVVLMDVPIAPDRDVSAIRTSVGYSVAQGHALPHIVERIGLDWTTVSALTPISTTPLPVLVPPVRGTDWVNSNAFGDPLTGHSGARMTKGTRLHANEAFAIDFIQLIDGASHTGDGTANEDYYAWGEPVVSSTAGTVISVRDGMPAIPPGAFPEDLTSIDQAGGNSVVVKAADDVYLLYGHLQAGSIPVKPGDRVKVGQRLGLLGNSGNSTGTHLHFQVSNGPDVMNADSIPFVFDAFTRTATITVDAAGGPVLTQQTKRFTDVYPTTLSILSFD